MNKPQLDEVRLPHSRQSRDVPRIFTLGQFKLQVGDLPIHLHSGAGTPLRLLKVLIALGSETVPVERVAETLWPDSDGDRAYGAFTTTLRRLRELIGHNTLILKGGRLTLSPEFSWVDAVEFELAVSRSARALEAGDTKRASKSMKSALELYRGPFLPGDFETGEILSARAQLHAMFLRTIESHGKRFQEQGKLDEAVTLYRRGIEVDGQAEDLYQRLLRCYLAQTRFAEGVALYVQYRDLLMATAGAAPSPEMESLYQDLLNAQRQSIPVETIRKSGVPQVQFSTTVPDPKDATHEAARLTGGDASLAEVAERRVATVACFRFIMPCSSETDIDPEEFRAASLYLNEEAKRAVSEHGGYVAPLAGSSVLAWFGMPHAHDDDPHRAVQTAVTLRDRFIHRSDIHAEKILLGLGVGIATGTVVVAGRGAGLDNEAVGLPVDRSIELSASARPGQILSDSQTWREVREFFSAARIPTPAGSVQGAFGPMEILQPLACESRFEAAQRSGLSPFTGREWELQTLQHFLQVSGQGKGQPVSIVGEAGIGKSRLLHEFRRSMNSAETRTFEGRCLSYGNPTPYLPILEVIRQSIGLANLQDQDRLHDVASANIRAISPDLEEYLPHLLHLLSIPSATHPFPTALQGIARRHELEDAFTRLITALSKRKPLVLILEDWHWADEASEAALHALVSKLATFPILVLVAYRPERFPSWKQVDNHRVLSLLPLDGNHTGRMLRSVLNVENLPPGLEESVHARTQGNALFVEELSHALIDEQIVEKVGDTVLLNRKPDDIGLPSTIRAVIQARIDHLERGDREVLKFASAIGQQFELEILDSLVGNPSRVSEAIARLASQDLVRPLRSALDRRYGFKHVLTQEVTHETLLLTQRRELHGRIGSLIESRYHDSGEQFCDVLANHFSQSENIDKAVEYLEKAGDKAIRQSALETARSYYGRALDLLGTSNSGVNRTKRAVDLAHKLASISEFSPSAKVLEALNAARVGAAALGDVLRLATTDYWTGRLHYILGELPQATRCFEAAMSLADQCGDIRLKARTLSALGRTCVYTAEHARGISYMTSAVGLMETTGEIEEVAYSSHVLGLHHGMLGDFESALRCSEHGLEIAIQRKLISRQPIAQNQLAWLQGLRGEFAKGLETINGARGITQRAGDTYTMGIAAIVEGWLRFMVGEPGAGVSLMIQGIKLVESLGSSMALTQWYGLLAEAFALVGEYGEARHYAESGISIARGGQRHGESIAYRAMGIIAASQTDASSGIADEWMAKSIRTANELHERPNAAIAHLRIAEIHTRRHEIDHANARASIAKQEFQDMGMTGWLAFLPGVEQGVRIRPV